MSDKDQNQVEKISLVGEELPCQHEGCASTALSLSPFCNEHIEDWDAYRKRIEEWHKEGKSLEGFYLVGAKLQEAKLLDANLQAANLSDANLQEADLAGAKLQEGNLRWANLQAANLFMTDLRASNLSNITGSETNWSRARLSDAVLSFQDLQNVHKNTQGRFWRTKEAEGS